MMFPSNRVRVLVSTQPVDFRKGHDGLAAIVSSVLRKDPFTGTVFVFRSRRADRLKLLYWGGLPQNLAFALWGDAQGHINGLIFDLAAFRVADFDPKRIKENDWIHRLQGAVLPV
ncbi:IS66 Orf2 like protein [Roseovarius gaetbuli]|uniref:IS66 Orf2 like protein n=1 Tax=Roseovarius gaetbuli TaxID=1356575 RepID=A0A1X7ADH2_9RHOB|nr:IS66 Orf2 like protein [Roseovarius gaetbuli]